jgi:hypothetical protein
MRILVDENIPNTTVHELRAKGHDVLDIRGTDSQGMFDDELWSLAQTERRTLVTTDKGFGAPRRAALWHVDCAPATAQRAAASRTDHGCVPTIHRARLAGAARRHARPGAKCPSSVSGANKCRKIGCTRTAVPRFSLDAPGSLDAGYAASVRFRRRSVIRDVRHKQIWKRLRSLRSSPWTSWRMSRDSAFQ